MYMMSNVVCECAWCAEVCTTKYHAELGSLSHAWSVVTSKVMRMYSR
jgi:hypothetical protein